MGEPVTVKGNGNKLEFWLDEELGYAELREALINRLDVNASFYIGSQRPVVFYGKIFTDVQKRELRNLMAKGYCFNHVSFVDDDTEPEENKPGQVSHETPENESHKEYSGQNDNNVSNNDVFITQTVRGGQRIETQGNITVVGDVNAGSELIAGGNIAVFGRLSGMVHAGAGGDTTVSIAANKLMASQIRIGSKIAVLPKKHKADKPEIITVIDDKIVITSIN